MTTRQLCTPLLLLAALLCRQAVCFPTGIPGSVNTYAGNDAIFADAGQAATSAHLVQPTNVVVDRAGNVYIAASGLSMVLKVATNGVVSIFAGNGLSSGTGDGGPAVGASLLYPSGLAFDSQGNLYIADTNNSNVRKVDNKGIITTVAGDSGTGGFSGDGGLATQALLANPTAIAFDSHGNLYIADTGNQRVRMVNTSGIISTIAGTGAMAYSGDNGPAAQAALSLPAGLALDALDNLYIADQNNWRIRKISKGVITTVAGSGWGYGGDNGPAIQAKLKATSGVAVDSLGNVYVADSGNQRIRRIDANGVITTIAGTGMAGFGGDGGAATLAQFSSPNALALDSTGAVLVADVDNNRIRRVVPGGLVTTIAGTITSIGDSGASTQARLVSTRAVALDAAANLFIADSGMNRIRKVTTAGTITTLAGNGQAGNSGNGGPASVAIDSRISNRPSFRATRNAIVGRIPLSTSRLVSGVRRPSGTAR